VTKLQPYLSSEQWQIVLDSRCVVQSKAARIFSDAEWKKAWLESCVSDWKNYLHCDGMVEEAINCLQNINCPSLNLFNIKNILSACDFNLRMLHAKEPEIRELDVFAQKILKNGDENIRDYVVNHHKEVTQRLKELTELNTSEQSLLEGLLQSWKIFETKSRALGNKLSKKEQDLVAISTHFNGLEQMKEALKMLQDIKLDQTDEALMKEINCLSDSLSDTFKTNLRKSDFDEGYVHKLQSMYNELESIIEFRIKEIKSKIAIADEFGSKMESLRKSTKELEDELPTALQEGLRMNPEKLMALRKRFDEKVRHATAIEEQMASDLAEIKSPTMRFVTDEILINRSEMRHIHENISRTEEELGRNLKHICEHQELASEIKDWLESAKRRLEAVESGRLERQAFVALCVESSSSGEQMVQLERLEQNISADVNPRGLRQDLCKEHVEVKSWIQRTTKNVRPFPIIPNWTFEREFSGPYW